MPRGAQTDIPDTPDRDPHLTGWSALEQFLATDPRDVGCEQAMELLHLYAELAGENSSRAAERYPGIGAHLRACGPCSEDFDGLLAAIAGAP